jgi:2-polyprenyl-6-methoxyphenol hydroxylase-like FAD-dependent oxidoreductase
MRQKYDIVIAGGGMIGSSLALALAPLGLRVAVIEPVARKGAEQPSFDERSTALSRSTQRMFEAMGLWSGIVAASTPITGIHVSDQGRFGFSHIDAEEQGVEALGYVVINRVLGGVLQDALDNESGIHLLCPATVTDVDLSPDRAVATVEFDGADSHELECALLVAADGANSCVRAMMASRPTSVTMSNVPSSAICSPRSRSTTWRMSASRRKGRSPSCPSRMSEPHSSGPFPSKTQIVSWRSMTTPSWPNCNASSDTGWGPSPASARARPTR